MNKSIYCICIESFNVLLQFLQIMVRKRQIFEKNYTLVFIEMNNEDLQHCWISR